MTIGEFGIKGDLDDDGRITQDDLDILGKYIAGHPIADISPLPEYVFLWRADVNDDGVVNILDLAALAALVEEQAPQENWVLPVIGIAVMITAVYFTVEGVRKANKDEKP